MIENAARTYGELWTSSNDHVFLFLLACNWICGWADIAVNSMEFWKFIVSLFNGILPSTLFYVKTEIEAKFLIQS